MAPWDKPCPVEGGDNLEAMLAAHLSNAEVQVRWVTKAGKEGIKPARRFGSYSPNTDGTTIFACVDCDGGGRHGNPLVDPLGVALRILKALRKVGVVAHLECSGSGSGWHLWIFSAYPYPPRRSAACCWRCCQRTPS